MYINPEKCKEGAPDTAPCPAVVAVEELGSIDAGTEDDLGTVVTPPGCGLIGAEAGATEIKSSGTTTVGGGTREGALCCGGHRGWRLVDSLQIKIKIRIMVDLI